jgi:hypothetical protein
MHPKVGGCLNDSSPFERGIESCKHFSGNELEISARVTHSIFHEILDQLVLYVAARSDVDDGHRHRAEHPSTGTASRCQGPRYQSA